MLVVPNSEVNVVGEALKGPPRFTFSGEKKVSAGACLGVDEGAAHITGIHVGLAVRCLACSQPECGGFDAAANVVVKGVPAEACGVELLGGLKWFTHTNSIARAGPETTKKERSFRPSPPAVP